MKQLLNKCKNMNFRAIHDVKRVMNRVDRRSSESTETPGQTITKLCQLEYLVVIFLEFLNACFGRSLDAIVSQLIALNEQILPTAICFASVLRTFFFKFITKARALTLMQ